jgi:glyoxylase-like metal-dependent hydrolase (beta-lactamase superfamily II)
MDHVSGNVEFPPGVEIVAHEAAAASMREMRPVAGGPPQPNLFQEQGGRGLPTRTFRDRLTLGDGDERVELYHFGRGHTDGDSWVHFPAVRAVHCGDAFAYKALPPLDTNNGASGLEYPETLARAIRAFPADTTVITGHYPATLGMEDLRVFEAFVRDFVEAVRSARGAGATIDDFVATWRLPDRLVAQGYVDFSQLRPIRPDVEALWYEVR